MQDRARELHAKDTVRERDVWIRRHCASKSRGAAIARFAFHRLDDGVVWYFVFTTLRVFAASQYLRAHHFRLDHNKLIVTVTASLHSVPRAVQVHGLCPQVSYSCTTASLMPCCALSFAPSRRPQSPAASSALSRSIMSPHQAAALEHAHSRLLCYAAQLIAAAATRAPLPSTTRVTDGVMVTPATPAGAPFACLSPLVCAVTRASRLSAATSSTSSCRRTTSRCSTTS